MRFKDTIEFRTDPPIFFKERHNQKPNTVRDTSDWDNTRWFEYFNADFIKIINSSDSRDYFIRKIRDKTQYKNLIIISW